MLSYLRRSPRRVRRLIARMDDGQVLVVFAGGLMLLLLVGALVIDVGFVWLIRRQEQNAADPGAIAAARYIRAETDPVARMAIMRRAACFYARQNGFFGGAPDDDGCVPANDSNDSVLTVHYPPSRGAGEFAGRSGYVEVVIDRPHVTFLARIVGLGTINVVTSAVAAFSSGDSNSSSLVALDPDDCQAGKISGNASVNIFNVAGATGGYVQVNSDCGNDPPTPAADDDLCANGSGALKIDGTAHLTAPQTNVVGTCIGDMTDLTGALDEESTYVADPLQFIPPLDLALFSAQNCGTGPVLEPTGPRSDGCKFNTAGVVNLEPGIYYGGWSIGNNVEVRLAPGIYIIAGGGVTLSAGGSLVSVGGDPTAIARVMIFSTDNPAYRDTCFAGGGNQFQCQRGLDFQAQATLRMRGLNTDPCPPVNAVGCPYRGILIWQDGKGSCSIAANPDTACPVFIGGQAEVDISGTIYAPLTHVQLDGGSATSGITPTAAVQIISNTWTITGGTTLDMPYDPNELYQLDQKGLVR